MPCLSFQQGGLSEKWLWSSQKKSKLSAGYNGEQRDRKRGSFVNLRKKIILIDEEYRLLVITVEIRAACQLWRRRENG